MGLEGQWCLGRTVVVLFKERVGLQPVQGYDTDKEGKTETSVGGRGRERKERAEGGGGRAD